MNVQEGHFQGYDGLELFFQTWPQKNTKAILLGIHGLGEHVDSYRLLAEGLNDSPFQLIMSDLRGHGRSLGKRGCGSIDDYVKDVKLFHTSVQERYPDVPIFFLGHSMGGLVLLKFLIRQGDQGALGAVLSSPLLGVAVEVAAFKKKSAGFLSSVLPNLTLSNEIPNEHLTHFKDVVKYNETDTLRHDRISPLLYTSILSSIDYVFSRSEIIQCPLFMQVAGDDLLVSKAKALEVFEKLKTKDREKKVYNGYYHEIYNEIWREKPISDLKDWLSLRLDKFYSQKQKETSS